VSGRRVLDRVLDEREVLCVLGPGGVGKTTLSAAIGLASSRRQRTLVVTIDPAKRLADALGLELGHEVAHVEENLDAVMVDTKKALDEQVERYAPNPDKVRRIFESPLYQELSSALVGSEEFAAMGLLHDYHVHHDYDLIVVDTPPAHHAVDFLTVNDRLRRVFDSGLTRFLFKPGKLFSVAGGRIGKVLARWTSREYLDTLSDFLLEFEDMFLDMEERVERMEELVHDPDRTALGLVAMPDPGAVSEALGLVEAVHGIGLAPSLSVANRVYPPLAGASPDDDRQALLDHYAALARVHADGVQRLSEQAGPVLTVPALAKLAGLDGLRRIEPYLLDGPAP
jgi:anion-transporting  ArsA/GET3 family ATPase